MQALKTVNMTVDFSYRKHSTVGFNSAALLFSAFSHPQVRNAPGPADGHSKQRA